MIKNIFLFSLLSPVIISQAKPVFQRSLYFDELTPKFKLNERDFNLRIFRHLPACGNGNVQSSQGEQCDDGNTINGDGCSSSCIIEAGWTCSGSPSICNRCGDSVIQGNEQCDDGNIISGDGCSSLCMIETGWTCRDSPSICSICGNGFVRNGEECDDGNKNNGDGCSSLCTIEAGWICSGSPSICNRCGDSVIQNYEQCDDGNTQNGDGCNSSCMIESGWTCRYSPSVCFMCGNGLISNGEQCDDGNTNNGDGCSNSCTIEAGWTCSGSPSICNRCGDSKIEGREQCDDGNTNSNDGCSNFCSIESSWTCTGTPSVCTRSVTSYCGDGKISNDEECDDGNKSNSDGCSSTCQIEPGYICENYPSNCVLVSELGGAAATIGKTTLYTIVVNLFASVISSFVFEGSAINMWAMLNMLQILHFVPMMTLYYPQVLLTMFSYIGLVNMNNLLLFALFSLMINQSEISSKSGLDYRFDNQSFSSTNIFMNSGDTFAFVMIAFVYIITITILSLIFKPTQNDNLNQKIRKCSFESFKRLLRLMREAIFFNFFIRFGYESFLELGLAVFLNVYLPSVDTVTEKESIGAVCACGLFLICIWVITLCVSVFIKPETLEKHSVKNTIGSIYSGLKLTKFGPRLFQLIFLFRRTVIVIILVFLWKKGLTQLIVFTCSNLIVTVHLLMFRPYESKIACVHTFINEILLLTICGMCFFYIEIKTELTTEIKSEITAYICICCCLAVVVFQIIVIIATLIKNCVLKSSKKLDPDVSSSMKILPLRNIFDCETVKENNTRHSQSLHINLTKEESKMQIYKMKTDHEEAIHTPETSGTPIKDLSFDDRNVFSVIKKISIRDINKLRQIDIEEDS